MTADGAMDGRFRIIARVAADGARLGGRRVTGKRAAGIPAGAAAGNLASAADATRAKIFGFDGGFDGTEAGRQ